MRRGFKGGSPLHCIKTVVPMNPCPCGYFPDRTRCTCTNAQVKKYLTRISTPLLDRIDMCVEAHRVKYDELTTGTAPGQLSGDPWAG